MSQATLVRIRYLRGGSHANDPQVSVVIIRINMAPRFRNFSIGLRLVRRAS